MLEMTSRIIVSLMLLLNYHFTMKTAKKMKLLSKPRAQIVLRSNPTLNC